MSARGVTAARASCIWGCLLVAWLASCKEPAEGPCKHGVCQCEDQDACAFDCADPHCDLSCRTGESCLLSCGESCNARCIGAGSCGTNCGRNCQARCEDVATCTPVVGENSYVNCTRVGVCDVVCEGTCFVTCSRVGACNVTCEQGLPTSCADGRVLCGRPCSGATG